MIRKVNHWGTHNRQKKMNFHRIVCLSHRERALLLFLVTGVIWLPCSDWQSVTSAKESQRERERASRSFISAISWNIHTNRLTRWIRLIMFTVPADTGAVGRKGQFSQTYMWFRVWPFCTVWEWICGFVFSLICVILLGKWMLWDIRVLSWSVLMR